MLDFILCLSPAYYPIYLAYQVSDYFTISLYLIWIAVNSVFLNTLDRNHLLPDKLEVLVYVDLVSIASYLLLSLRIMYNCIVYLQLGADKTALHIGYLSASGILVIIFFLALVHLMVEISEPLEIMPTLLFIKYLWSLLCAHSLFLLMYINMPQIFLH